MGGNMKKLFVLFLMICMLSLHAATICPKLEKALKLHPEKKHHVLAFLKVKIDPAKLAEDRGVRSKTADQMIKLIDVVCDHTKNQAHWLLQYIKKYDKKQLSNIKVHGHLQAVSFKAIPEVIREIARDLQSVKKIVLFCKEHLKPHDFFITEDYYKPVKVEVQIIPDRSEGTPVTLSKKTREEGDIDITKIINIFKEVWKFIGDNKPVVNANAYACAIPKGSNSDDLAGWRSRYTGKYIMTYKNLYGFEVVKIAYKIQYYYDGSYNGKGHFLTNVLALLDDLYVAWGYTVNSTIEIPENSLINVGSKEDPISEMKVLMKYSVSTIVNSSQGTVTCTVTGNGNYRFD